MGTVLSYTPLWGIHGYEHGFCIKEVWFCHRHHDGVRKGHDFVIDITMMNIGCTDLS